MVEYKSITGIVQSKTPNSLKIDNLWVKFFDILIISQVNEGDKVTVKYQDKSKDGRTYHNGKEIIMNLEDKKLTSEKQMSDTTLNCILLIAKDIYLSEKTKLEYKEVVKDVLEGYKLIIKG